MICHCGLPMEYSNNQCLPCEVTGCNVCCALNYITFPIYLSADKKAILVLPKPLSEYEFILIKEQIERAMKTIEDITQK